MSAAAVSAARAERRQQQHALQVEIAQRDVSEALLMSGVVQLAGTLDTLRTIDEALAVRAAELGLEYAPAYARLLARVTTVLEAART